MTEKGFRFLILLFAFGVFFVAARNTTMAQTATTITTTVNQPINFAAQTCDTTEPISFTGTQDTVYEVVNDGTGVLKLQIHSSWENVLGTTAGGHLFRGTNMSDENIDLDSLPSDQTVTMDQLWIGRAIDSTNMVYTLTFKITIGADGKVTAQKNSEIVECKQ